MCAAAVLLKLKDKLSRILTCCRQQLHETCIGCILQLILLTYCINFHIVYNYYPKIFLYKLLQFYEKPLGLLLFYIFYFILLTKLKHVLRFCTLL